MQTKNISSQPRNEASAALRYIEQLEQSALVSCRHSSCDHTLTQDEYDLSTPAFKEMIATPWQKGEPIYIVPEKNGNGKLHPELLRLMRELNKGTYYDQFIKVGSGTLWPLVLRLYYGLDCGFRISMEQMCAMLQVSYCLDAQLEIEHVPFFEDKTQQIGRIGTKLVQTIFYFEDISNQEAVNERITTKINPYRDAVHKAPAAEQAILKIKLDKKYFDISKNGEVAFFTPPHLVNELKNSGLELLYTIVMSKTGFKSVYRENDTIFLLLPSFTMLNIYNQMLNPDRALTYQPRLGIITPHTLEAYSNLNQRMGNLYAPGITNPKIAHGAVVLPISMYVHDVYYHFFLDAILSSDTHTQLLYIVTLLRTSVQDSMVMTTELRRCTDREFSIKEDSFKKNQHTSFPNMIEKIFSIPSSRTLSPSFVILLVDAILHPSKLPYISQSLEGKFYRRFLQWDNRLPFSEFKEKVERYNRELHGHSAKIAILILCRFYLNDIEFCQALIENMKHNSAALTVTWGKNSDKHLHPVFRRNNLSRSLTDLTKLSSIQRIQELAPILYSMPEYNDQDQEKLSHLIREQKGDMIFTDSKITHFFMASALLQAPIRKQFKLDRLKGNDVNEQQIAYLKRKIPQIVIETIIEDKDKSKVKAKPTVATLFTFPESQRDLVKSVLTEWKQLINIEATKIQTLYRSYSGKRIRFFGTIAPKDATTAQDISRRPTPF